MPGGGRPRLEIASRLSASGAWDWDSWREFTGLVGPDRATTAGWVLRLSTCGCGEFHRVASLLGF